MEHLTYFIVVLSLASFAIIGVPAIIQSFQKKIFELSELDGMAYQKAIETLKLHQDFSHWEDTFRFFITAFGLEASYDVSADSSAYVYMKKIFSPDNRKLVTGNRLRTWFINNTLDLFTRRKVYMKRINGTAEFRVSRIMHEDFKYPFTGVYTDQIILRKYKEFLDSPHPDMDYGNVMLACLNHYVSEWKKEMEERYSPEYLKEYARANSVLFKEDGTLIQIV